MGLANSEHAICFIRWIFLIRLRSHCLLAVHCEEMRNNWRTHYFDWQTHKIRQNVLTGACPFNKRLAVVLCRHSGRHGDGCRSPQVLLSMGGRVSVAVAEVTDTHLWFFSVPQFNTRLMVFCDGIWGEGFLPKPHWQIRVVKQSQNPELWILTSHIFGVPFVTTLWHFRLHNTEAEPAACVYLLKSKNKTTLQNEPE